LPEETNKYIFRILTFKYLIENANELGFNVTDEDKYQSVPTKDFNVTSSIPDLAQFAINNGTTYKMLRVLNPWLKGKSLTVSNGRNYVIKLPAAGATALK
jgi:membrane-bound lytic murein transglycosylase D